MFREFFFVCERGNKRSVGIAWAGLIVVVGYSVFLAWIKTEINRFYTEFYDLLQEAGSITFRFAAEVAEAAGEDKEEDGSGAPSGSLDSLDSLDEDQILQTYRARVWAQLWNFAKIVAPLVTAAPAAKWVRSVWAFAWRQALMRAYLKAWDTSKEPIEGASQRLHEDTQRFSNALQGCLATMLDAVFTLGVFTPILLQLGDEIAPPVWIEWMANFWLWFLALSAAVVGLVGAMCVGQKLVGLEINNQRVEASLRRDLVLLETNPGQIVGMSCSQIDAPPHPQQTYSPTLYFKLSLERLSTNYHALFRHFSFLNLWLSLYDQVMVIFPYLVAAPLLFAEDAGERITLGTLIKLSNSFDKVFSSMSVIAENWSAVNEFRSVLVRMREFERRLYHNENCCGGGGLREQTPMRRRRASNCLLPSMPAPSDGHEHEFPEELPRSPHVSPRAHRPRSVSVSMRYSHASSGPVSSMSVPHGQELVVVDGAPVQISTTYSGNDVDGREGRDGHDMRV